MSIKACHLWFGFGFIALAATVFAFMNFWAAADLGYDATSRGKVILSSWCYAFIGLSLSTLTLFALGVRSWSAARRNSHLTTEP